jgi:RimJ/RimL family protein N-acetyltransferase
MVIRKVRAEDAEAFLALCLALDSESRVMMLEPGERVSTVADTQVELQRVSDSPNSAMFVAEESGELLGYVAAYGGEYRRNRHSASVVAGVRQRAAGQGIGRLLFDALLTWARESGVTRLELTVMTHNERAIRLYSRLGFQVEGTRKRSLVVEGKPVDELAMALLL